MKETLAEHAAHVQHFTEHWTTIEVRFEPPKRRPHVYQVLRVFNGEFATFMLYKQTLHGGWVGFGQHRGAERDLLRLIKRKYRDDLATAEPTATLPPELPETEEPLPESGDQCIDALLEKVEALRALIAATGVPPTLAPLAEEHFGLAVSALETAARQFRIAGYHQARELAGRR